MRAGSALGVQAGLCGPDVLGPGRLAGGRPLRPGGRLLLEVEDGASGAQRVQEALRAGLGIRMDCAHVAAGSLPRFELKARRVVRR